MGEFIKSIGKNINGPVLMNIQSMTVNQVSPSSKGGIFSGNTKFKRSNVPKYKSNSRTSEPVTMITKGSNQY